MPKELSCWRLGQCHGPLEGKQIWEVVSDLRDKKVIRDVEPNLPKLKGVENNPGIVL